MRRLSGLLLVGALLGVVVLVAQSGRGGGATGPYTTWTAYQGGAHSSQYTALDQINTSNVDQLQVVWTYPVSGTITFNPIVVDDVLYTRGSSNTIVALHAATGDELWSYQADGGFSARGFNYWESGDRSDRRLVFLAGGSLTALDAETGDVIASFGNEGKVDLRDALWREVPRPVSTSNPGRVFDDLFIMPLHTQGAGYEATPADVHAYDIRTGQIRWVFHSVPQPGEFGYDTWPPGAFRTAGGVHNWSEMTVDEENGIAFIPFGTARYDFYGGNREGANLYGNSLVALDARTGERLWHQQLVHHDLWDYDIPQAPKLLTLRRDGREVEVVAQATKQGFVFVFDRRTGEPFFPIEERPVPQSDLPGEHSWPTQPFPTLPPPFARQSITAADINPFLPQEEQQAFRELRGSARNEGLFTPPSFEGSIQMPGHNGGANWGSSAVDPVNGEFYVVAKNMPTLLQARLTTEEPTAGGALGGGPGGGVVTPAQKATLMAEAQAAAAEGPVRYSVPYDFMQGGTNGMTAVGPPWSEITAYDLNTGQIKWRVPDGSTTAPPELGIPADAGSHMPRGGPLVTAGGLVFVATASDRTLRAYDRDNGQVVWSTELPTGSEGVPASYQVDGRQYIVVPVAAGTGSFSARFGAPAADGGGRGGRGGAPAQPTGAYMAFALPR
jgi:quinoprotein glucose dehydrogenase